MVRKAVSCEGPLAQPACAARQLVQQVQTRTAGMHAAPSQLAKALTCFRTGDLSAAALMLPDEDAMCSRPVQGLLRLKQPLHACAVTIVVSGRPEWCQARPHLV